MAVVYVFGIFIEAYRYAEHVQSHPIHTCTIMFRRSVSSWAGKQTHTRIQRGPESHGPYGQYEYGGRSVYGRRERRTPVRKHGVNNALWSSVHPFVVSS